jgi:hypothetical protein
MACTPQLVVMRTPATGPGTARSSLEPMANEVMDWDSAYRQEGVFEGPPPWNIGEPQPELAALVAAGKVRTDVLDAGCGYAGAGGRRRGLHRSRSRPHPNGDHGRYQGCSGRWLTNAGCVQADITSLTGYDGRFNTLIDSTLFHSLAVEGREGYLGSVHRAAAPGASYYVLVFAEGAFNTRNQRARPFVWTKTADDILKKRNVKKLQTRSTRCRRRSISEAAAATRLAECRYPRRSCRPLTSGPPAPWRYQCSAVARWKNLCA